MPNKPAAAKTTAKAADKVLAAAIRKLQKMPSGFVTDSLGRLGIGGWMNAVLPVQPKGRFVGPAVTLRWAPARNAGTASMSIYDFIRTCRPGQVLVMETSEAKSSPAENSNQVSSANITSDTYKFRSEFNPFMASCDQARAVLD